MTDDAISWNDGMTGNKRAAAGGDGDGPLGGGYGNGKLSTHNADAELTTSNSHTIQEAQ